MLVLFDGPRFSRRLNQSGLGAGPINHIERHTCHFLMVHMTMLEQNEGDWDFVRQKYFFCHDHSYT